MNVFLISSTYYPEIVCATAARTCYSRKTPEEIYYDSSFNKENDEVLEDVIASGHDSVLEHAVFTFAVSGVSRVTTHQLVRHRMASYEQQSQRYVRPKCYTGYVDGPLFDWVVPKSVKDTPNYETDYDTIMRIISDAYERLLAAGVPEEDARYILPNACTTNIVVTMNARELRHFFSLRLCRRAQWEIRELALKMYQECVKYHPVLFKDAGPACLTGKCREGKRSCGKPITIDELVGENDTGTVS